MSHYKGLATLVGSFPFKDAELALEMIFTYTPELPCWPQLPKRDHREGMVAQYSEGLPCIRVLPKGFYLDENCKEDELEAFYAAVIAQDLERFKISEDHAAGLWKFYKHLGTMDLTKVRAIKCSVVGPFTYAASVNDAAGKTLLNDEVFMQVAIKGMTMKALWQINLFKKFNKDIIVFFDEPYLGCFGSSFTPLNREDVVTGFNELIAAIKPTGAKVGIHCCGNTDWSMLAEVQGLDIINFDAFSYLERLVLYGEAIGKFFERGGYLCWGIVPTQEMDGMIPKDFLLMKIDEGLSVLKNKGIKQELLLERMMVSPACGMGSLDTHRVQPILKLLAEISAELRK